MKIITNHKLIKRNKIIGQITTFASLGVLGLGLYLSFKQTYISWSFAALLTGFLLSQVGIYYGSRWGKSPRPDERLNQALKGLDNKYTLYHYNSPVPHLLIGPAGIWTLIPYAQSGRISYDEKNARWKQAGGNAYLKIFAQEGLGRPDLEVQSFEKSMNKYLQNVFKDFNPIPESSTVLVFTNEKASLEAETASRPTLPAKKVKEYFRRQAKDNTLNSELLNILERVLPAE